MSLYPLLSVKHAIAEENFIKALGWSANYVIQGTTTPEIRRERLREMILAADPRAIMWQTENGAKETFRQAWERLYGLPFYGPGMGTAAIVESSDEIETFSCIGADHEYG